MSRLIPAEPHDDVVCPSEPSLRPLKYVRSPSDLHDGLRLPERANASFGKIRKASLRNKKSVMIFLRERNKAEPQLSLL